MSVSAEATGRRVGESLRDSALYHGPARAYYGPTPAWKLSEDPLVLGPIATESIRVSKLPGCGLSSEGPNRLAIAVHFGLLEDRNAPRIGSRGHPPSHIQRYLCEEVHSCYPITIGVSSNLS